MSRAPSGGEQCPSAPVTTMEKNQAEEQDERKINFTSQSDGKCFRHNPAPSASPARLPSVTPPLPVTVNM